MTSTAVYVAGRRVGSLRQGVFYKTIHGSRHFLRFPCTAIALDRQSLDEAENLDAHTVKITDAETRVTYTSTVAHIRAAGFDVDRGYGKQIALPLDGWIKSTTDRELPKQLILF